MTDAPRIARVLALQPPMTPDALAEPVMGTEDPQVLSALTNLIRAWAYENPQVPADFAEKAFVTHVDRQPVVYTTVELERCTRDAEAYAAPLPKNRAIDPKPWPTTDLFALVPPTPPQFATVRQTRHAPLPGREEARRCDDCDGAGETACDNCAGGRVPCPACGGANRVACPQCGGAGTHLGVSGRMIQCRRCNSVGTVRCERCQEQGTIVCPSCNGRGTEHCDTCDGHGNLVRGWRLVETATVDRRRHTHMAQGWPGDFDAMQANSDVATERVYVSTAETPQFTLDRIGPPAVQQQADTMLAEALDAHAALRYRGEVDDRVTAARVRLRGLYAYDVRLDYAGRVCEMLVAAGGAVIVPRQLPKRRSGPIAWASRLVGGYARALATDERAGPDKAFILAVRAGRAHVGDEAMLVPHAAARIDAKPEVTAAGYRVYVQDRAFGATPLSVAVDIRFELNDADATMVCVDIDLGEAHRDQFVRLLAANSELSIGRLAVADGEGGSERLVLVDRRPYVTSDAAQYAGVLRILASTARRLRGDLGRP